MQRFTPANPPERILVIALRYLGDVFLTTALLRGLRNAYPKARLDVLVYTNTAEILTGNPDINHIITTPNRPQWPDYQQLLPQIYRRYDLAISTQSGDRPFIYSLLAASQRIIAVPPQSQTGWWKRWFAQGWVNFDDEHTHTVIQHLKLLKILNAEPCYTLVLPNTQHETLLRRFPELFNSAHRYALLHPFPRWTYKQWTLTGWIALGRYLNARGIKVVFSGAHGAEELAYINEIANELSDTLNLAGQLSLAELSTIIAHSTLFVGPDTSVTHLAAATGVPVIALYGPTNPVKWAPWPNAYQQPTNPFTRIGWQQVNNVYLCQGSSAKQCVPCHREGCEDRQHSRSACLDALSFSQLQPLIDKLIGAPNAP